mgnify:CR=1 FL=1
MTPELTTHDGTAVAPFAFGTMQFGGRADAGDSRAMFEACRAAGIAHFDTAHVYTDGSSETLLGEFARPERDALFIATKAGYKGGASRDNILKTFDESRWRLGMDSVDLLYMHRWDDDTPLAETFETLADLQQRRLIRQSARPGQTHLVHRRRRNTTSRRRPRVRTPACQG